jgi:hypothetical protein
MFIFKPLIKQKLNSEPEITRRNEIFPRPENSGSSEDREKAGGVIENQSFIIIMKFEKFTDFLQIKLKKDSKETCPSAKAKKQVGRIAIEEKWLNRVDSFINITYFKKNERLLQRKPD